MGKDRTWFASLIAPRVSAPVVVLLTLPAIAQAIWYSVVLVEAILPAKPDEFMTSAEAALSGRYGVAREAQSVVRKTQP
jgi:hypothetical protein